VFTLYIMFNNFFFRTSCNVQGNAEKIGRVGQATDYVIGRMHLACWMTKDTDTHSEYVTLIVFPREQRLREGVAMLRL
jgi:hypothetical protein